MAWALLVASSALYFGSVNDADNDLWGHLFAGREILRFGVIPRTDPYSYTAAGLPWLDHEWLTQVVFASVYDTVGSAGLLLGKLALVLAMVALSLRTILEAQAERPSVSTPVARRASPFTPIAAAVAVLTLAVLARGLSIRPQLVTYAALAATLAALDSASRGRPARLWLLPPLFLLWANLHGGFVLGVAVLAVYSGWAALCFANRTLQPAAVLVAAAAATAVNPYGPRLLAYLWDELSRAHPISEWQPVQVGGAEHAAFLLMLGLVVVTLPFARDWRRWGWRQAIALIVGAFAVRHQRHTAVFALCAAAPLAVQLRGAAERLQRRGVHLGITAQRTLAAGVLLLALLQLALTGARFRRDGLAIIYDPHEYPVAAVARLKAGGAHGNLAVPLDWGAYVLWHLAPNVKPSIDGRFATVFPESVVEDNMAFFRGAPTWRRLIDDYPTQAALVPAGVAWRITREPGWQRVFADDVAALYVRSEQAAALTLGPAVPETAGTVGIFP